MSKSIPTGKEIWDIVTQLSEVEGREDEGNVISAILLTSAFTGPFPTKIAKHIHLPPDEVKGYEKRIRKNKLWVGRKVAGSEWFDDSHGGIALILDTLCVQGLIERQLVPND